MKKSVAVKFGVYAFLKLVATRRTQYHPTRAKVPLEKE
jgi:hypothetical protein